MQTELSADVRCPTSLSLTLIGTHNQSHISFDFILWFLFKLNLNYIVIC